MPYLVAAIAVAFAVVVVVWGFFGSHKPKAARAAAAAMAAIARRIFVISMVPSLRACVH